MLTLTRRLVLPLLALLLAVANTFAEEPNRNVRFGLPTFAEQQNVLSYNAKTRTPNCVCSSPTSDTCSPTAPAADARDGRDGHAGLGG